MIAKVKKNPTDPLGILVGGIVQILAAMGIFAKLDMGADQIATVGSGLFMVAAAIRFMMTEFDAETPAAQASTPEEAPAPEAPESDAETVKAPPPEDPETPLEDADKGDDEGDKPVVPPPPSVG